MVNFAKSSLPPILNVDLPVDLLVDLPPILNVVTTLLKPVTCSMTSQNALHLFVIHKIHTSILLNQNMYHFIAHILFILT